MGLEEFFKNVFSLSLPLFFPLVAWRAQLSLISYTFRDGDLELIFLLDYSCEPQYPAFNVLGKIPHLVFCPWFVLLLFLFFLSALLLFPYCQCWGSSPDLTQDDCPTAKPCPCPLQKILPRDRTLRLVSQGVCCLLQSAMTDTGGLMWVVSLIVVHCTSGTQVVTWC